MTKSDTDRSVAVKQIIADMLQKRNMTVETLAGHLEIPKARLDKYLNPNIENSFPAYLLPKFTHFMGPELSDHITHEAGRVPSQLPDRLQGWKNPSNLGSLMMRECGDFISLFADITKDSDICQLAVEALTLSIQRTIRVMREVELVAETMIKKVSKFQHSAPYTESKPGYVYILRYGYYYKIGKANNVSSRITDLGVSMPEEPELIHTIEASEPFIAEKYLHDLFESQKVRREWYDLTEDNIQWLKGLTRIESNNSLLGVQLATQTMVKMVPKPGRAS